MCKRTLAMAVAALFISTCLFSQGLETKATKEDWEEINFEFNSSILSDGYPTLLRLADLLKQNPDWRLQAEGHTDYVGSVPYNEKLALARGEAVKSFLVKYGAGANQVQVSGQGKRSPEVPNTTKEGRFINRRVELTVTDGQGKVIASGTAAQVVDALDERLKKLEDCCNQILKKLDKLDEILAAVRDLKSENDRLKSDVAALKEAQAGMATQKQVSELPRPLTAEQASQIARTEATTALEAAELRRKKFSLIGLNIGPTMGGDLNFTGKGRFFAPFGHSGTHAVQAEGEYLYYGGNELGRQEGQFDFGLVNRWNRVQAGLFSSFKYVNMKQFSSGGTLGQGAFTLDVLFNRGRVGLFGTKGFKDNAVVNRAQLGINSFTETYLKIVDQIGGSAQVGMWGDSYVEGNIAYLNRQGGDNRPGGMLRLVQPLNQHWAFTVEAGLNETLLSANDSGRIVFGFQLGNWLRPKEYMDVRHPVPVDIPRIRYELLTRRVGNSAPVADAGPDQVGVAAGTIQLNGSASYDPDGDPLTYQWAQIAGPNVGLTGATTATPTFPAAEGQSYSFRLTVRDPGGLQSTARVTVTTRAALRVRILRFVAQPNVIRVGQAATLIWDTENADTVEIAGIGRVANSGTQSVAPTETTVYRLTARNAQGELNEQVTVTVERQDARILRFLAQPATILPGEAATLIWAVENATEITISGVGTVSQDGTTTVTPTQTTTYTLTARGRFNTVTATATVQVNPRPGPRILRFTASPPEILPTEQSTLVWEVENATDINISGIGRVDPTGSSTVSPTANTTYTITARNAQGEVSATAVVTVITPVKILNFVADPPSVITGNRTTLRWSTTNATEVVITGIGTVPANGTREVTVTSDVSFTLLAYGNRSQASAFVLVKATPNANRPPVADAGPDQIIYRNTTALDGTGSFDPENDPITYSWRFVSLVPDPATRVPGSPSTPTITNATTARPTILMPQWGTYIYELTVSDNKGNRSTSVTRVTFVDP